MNDEEIVYLLAALERELTARLLAAGVSEADISSEMRALLDAALASRSNHRD
jgi:hypothetical protein